MSRPFRHCLGPKHGMCAGDVHNWFELTYANYLVLPRSLLQEMPADWQHRFVRLLEDMQATFVQPNDNYSVLLRGEDGRFVPDPFRHYRHPDRSAIEAARVTANLTDNGART